MRINSLGCALCKDCEGAGFLQPPDWYAGSFSAPILIMAQNPGTFNPTTSPHLDKLVGKMWSTLNDGTATPGLIKSSYQWMFSLSKAAKFFAELVGDPKWLTSGRFIYTNAVRCCTPNNQRPSAQMQENCKQWTRPLLRSSHRKAFILVGTVARDQVLSDKSPWNVPLSRGDKHLICIKHYAALRSTVETDEAISAVRRFLERVT
jgi:hypothetical protein